MNEKALQKLIINTDANGVIINQDSFDVIIALNTVIRNKDLLEKYELYLSSLSSSVTSTISEKLSEEVELDSSISSSR